MRVVSTTQRLAKVPPTRHTKPATTRGKILSGGIGALIGIVLGAWSASAWPQAQWVADPVGVSAPPSSVVSVVLTPSQPLVTTVAVRPAPKPAPPVTRTVTPTPTPSLAASAPTVPPSSVPPAPSVSVSLPLPVG